MKRIKALALAGACLAAVAVAPAQAASTTFKVTVTVVARPNCVINGNKPIEVDFGEVVTTKINGSNYRVPVTYGLQCTGTNNKRLALRIAGAPATFDAAALRTSVDGLGIRLYVDDELLDVNSGSHSFDYSTKPALFAVPVRQANTQLRGGEFTAAATLKVEYS
ncbi:fimbrial protein [Pseudomonas sp. zfem005]|uniref:fimbrial protein n=1 Tax=Pseudomonas sp. zfem005 TaxID=3078200 RepID=UPI002928A251|nr:fimbrial protein [Pseudomonas sp. zfem005]MDU9414384.1 fimbrial protein [Pseudomonas sp. zfem005]